MLRTEKMADGAGLACGRIDELVRLAAGGELGRWMISVAERYAADSCRCRSVEGGGRSGRRAQRSGARS